MPNSPNYLNYNDRLKVFKGKLKDNPEPTPGTYYIVIRYAFLDTISTIAYGHNGRAKDIWDANKELLKNRNIESISGLPQIYPNDSLWLPPDDTGKKEPDEIPAESKDEIAIRINGKIFKGYQAANIERAINTIADQFSFDIPFDHTDPDSVYFDPYTYLPADLFIGGELYISGRCESWQPKFTLNETIMTVECRSFPSIIIDCNSEDSSLNYKNQTLKQIADRILMPFGILTEFPFGDSAIFKSVKRNTTDKIFSFLQGLAQKAGFVMNSSVDGKIVFDKANIDGKPILSLIQGEQPLIGISANYDGTNRFSNYTAISQGRGKPGNRSVVEDKGVVVKRPIIFTANNTNQGNILKAAEWKRSRTLAKSAPVSCVVSGWRDLNDDLIRENNIVTLLAPNVNIYNETKFLIERVNPDITKDGGRVTNLSLVLPQAYTTDFPTNFPWER